MYIFSFVYGQALYDAGTITQLGYMWRKTR